MITCLLYRSFWGLYDQMGKLVVAGVLFGLTLFSGFLVALEVAGRFGVLPALITGMALLIIAFGVCFSAIMPVATAAAAERPAAWRMFLAGLKQNVLRTSVLGAGFSLILLILMINIRFYAQALNLAPGSLLKYGFLIAFVLSGWIAIFVMVLGWPVLCALNLEANNLTFSNAIKAAFVRIIITPGLWLAVSCCALVITGLTFWFPPAVFLFLPVIAVMAQVSWDISGQYMTFLAEAKHQDPEGTIVTIRKRARILFSEYEARQPKRGIKELIKPWEV